MSEVALLNPQADSDLALRLLEITRINVQKHQINLTTRLFPTYEEYVKEFGAMRALEESLEAMEKEYRRTVNR